MTQHTCRTAMEYRNCKDLKTEMPHFVCFLLLQKPFCLFPADWSNAHVDESPLHASMYTSISAANALTSTDDLGCGSPPLASSSPKYVAALLTCYCFYLFIEVVRKKITKHNKSIHEKKTKTTMHCLHLHSVCKQQCKFYETDPRLEQVDVIKDS